MKHLTYLTLLCSLLLLIGCGHSVEAPETKGTLPENVKDDNIEIEDSAVAYVEADGRWRMVLVNRSNSTYLKDTKVADDVYHAPRTFDQHLRHYHTYCDQKIILNRDMQELIEFMRGRGFFDHAMEFDADELLPGKWKGGQAVVFEQGGKLYRMSKRQTAGGEMSQTDFARRKQYVDIKTQLFRYSRNYKHYEVKQNVPPGRLQPREPLVKPKYKDQMQNKQEPK